MVTIISTMSQHHCLGTVVCLLLTALRNLIISTYPSANTSLQMVVYLYCNCLEQLIERAIGRGESIQ